MQKKKHKKTEEEREGQESQQAARETVGSGRQLRPQVQCVCVAVQEMHCSGRGPGLSRDEVRTNPFPGSSHLMLSLTEGRERKAISEGGGKIVWANAFPTLFRLVPPFVS